MKLKGPLISATFINRPNRFLTIVKVNQKELLSHLPDPGRLEELLKPGAKIYIRKAGLNAKRKTQYSTVLVNTDHELVSLDTTLPNRFVAELLKQRALPFFEKYECYDREVKLGSHRIDFRLIADNGATVYLEVKSATYVDNKIARFPDAVTKRGTQHMQLLQSLAINGKAAAVLFVCQRSDPVIFKPFWDRDPIFSEALVAAQNSGVEVRCITTKITKEDISYYKEIPVNLKS
ncbi:DNA/RNA nuclease SfsA [Candidatus Neomarinimicrobiota bacterium]